MTITGEWLEATNVENAELPMELLLGLGIGESFKFHSPYGVTEPPVVVAGDVVGEAHAGFWGVTEAPVVVAGDYVVGKTHAGFWGVHYVPITTRREELEKEPSDVEAEELKQFAYWLAQRLDKISDGLESIHRKNKESQKKIEKLLQISDLGDEEDS